MTAQRKFQQSSFISYDISKFYKKIISIIGVFLTYGDFSIHLTYAHPQFYPFSQSKWVYPNRQTQWTCTKNHGFKFDPWKIDLGK